MTTSSRRTGHKRRPFSLQDVQALLVTHGIGGMCLHGFNNPAGFHTMNAYIAVPNTGDLWISHGNPCKTRLHRFSLDG